jgi:DMSO/TMAO reductase YedYZ molybdopterin-dependent catalytic subunit
VTRPPAPLIRTALSGALAGLLTGAVALGVAELVAGITGAQGAPIVAVGGVAIDHTPVPVKEFAITHFGTHDKDALIAGILVVLAGFAAVLGIVALRWLTVAMAGLAAFAVIGASAALTRPNATVTDALPTIAGVAVAALTLCFLARAAAPNRPGPDGVPDRPGPDGVPDRPGPDGVLDRPGPDGAPIAGSEGRRRFLLASAGAAAVAVTAGAAGNALLGRFSVASARAQVKLPDVPAPPVPAGTELGIGGLTPFFTSNDAFYRVDTDLVLPQVDPRDWTLRVDGMVDRELEISFAELLRMPLTEADITLVCVSNEVGGTYNGNARWLGAPLAGLLRKAGIKAGADQVLSSAADGMTISTPVEAIMDGRDALLAVGMNGQPLPVAHGFPARMIVPGLYGYVSATKWVTRLTLTTFAERQAYWTQRGYAATAPIKTESRIDVPKPLARVGAGRVPVAGVAWAPSIGIAAVEVQVDGGPWQQARLAAADGIDTWRQWVWDWDATPGLHQLQVRATDATGATQPSRRAPPFPDGASGWDSVVVTVT